tara:strand:+ start:23764 stop:23934 length:171 start_codon:yes stop_codon:yes gene_type:complete
MKKKTKKRKKVLENVVKKQKEPNKNSAKLVLFIFGLGPIIGIILFLASKGFFNTPY